MLKEKNVVYEQQFAEIHQMYDDRPDEVSGRSAIQPCEPLNSSSRKIMLANQKKQAKNLIMPEVPYFSTGREDMYGHESSAYNVSEHEWEVLAKVVRFSMFPNHEYYLIVVNELNEIRMIPRVAYNYNTETFGYLWNNEYLDSLNEGDIIHKGDVFKKSTSFDEYNHYRAGTNALSTYMSLGNTTEDPVVISESFKRRLNTPSFKTISIKLNENDVFINHYGNNDVYKAFPDLGEEVKDGILCSIRKATTDTMPFELSRDNVRNITISDETIITKRATVVDIKVYSNKQIAPGQEEGELYNVFEGQIAAYNNEEMRFARQFVEAMTNYIDNSDYKIDYQLEKMYENCRRRVNSVQFIEDGKLLSNIKIDITVYCEHSVEIGDKISNRMGGKGVISEIRADDLMPKIPGTNIPVDIIWDESTCVNRLNLAQLSELSVNFISRRILEFIDQNVFTVTQIWGILVEYYKIISPNLAQWLVDSFTHCETDDDVAEFLGSFLSERRALYIQTKPISECVDFDTIRKVYEKFPWIKPQRLIVPIENSDGSYRYVETSKPSVVGEMYVYVLKQEAEEKFSSTSVSPTNLRSENSKSKAAKNCRSAIANTPIRWGEMETGIFSNINYEYAVINTMITSSSEKGRRQVLDVLTGDAYTFDIHLSPDARSRAAEKTNTLLKGMGLRIKFIKTAIKKINPFKKIVYTNPFKKIVYRNPFVKVDKPFKKVDNPVDRLNEDQLKIVSSYREAMEKAMKDKK